MSEIDLRAKCDHDETIDQCTGGGSDRDPDDIKLEGGPRKPKRWETPLSYTGSDSECWACGLQPVKVIELATSRYYLCRTCAAELECNVLDTAAQCLKQATSKLRKELS